MLLPQKYLIFPKWRKKLFWQMEEWKSCKEHRLLGLSGCLYICLWHIKLLDSDLGSDQAEYLKSNEKRLDYGDKIVLNSPF